MVRRKLIWSPEAASDRIIIFKYWNQRNKSNVYSKRLAKLFRRESQKLLKQPFLGKVTSDKNLRALIIEHFLLIYLIRTDSIEIVNIWDGRRNPEDLKKLIDKN